ncbi:RNA polymerase sigma-70 factor [Rhizosphaericola mali]|uniref:RNA polymerase sigma-70 factor n=1 Tax=Rhizosphaericola mali TaxID=2545455 RepID=A0A5P2GAU9_9BACT|nr:RNA polymerase sigma-70 factor [Rhizosphaericola mali]QES88681.1 RNA polymerase sigma-70 factor [Rhizosphaericola mali]
MRLIIEASGFERLFKEKFKSLVLYANTFLNDFEISKEVVQSVFVYIWERKEKLEIRSSISAYLYSSVYNASIQYLRKNKRSLTITNSDELIKSIDTSRVEHLIESKELNVAIQKTLMKLPKQCRIIFSMSRFESKKYSEIATILGISSKAVEKQITKALKIFRMELSDFLPFLLIILEILNR